MRKQDGGHCDFVLIVLSEMGFLTENDVVKVKEIDRAVKNKFSFTWLE